ncbi:hypothetical protein ALIPUT_00489 [Alistipes putredinis DSM 17216]|uniref:Uncharacterized protein n=1 Tax=Alistipes putredinis DSM 17216 TaxID=445970 RepID=B0MU27_9BACT|nr:hypothetical protein ALIPUT_00489 [Alistipes putredinis DSM 17216]DAP23282.1 MAG TPA: hypothetical protein [Caudoviricetes sp.]
MIFQVCSLLPAEKYPGNGASFGIGWLNIIICYQNNNKNGRKKGAE